MKLVGLIGAFVTAILLTAFAVLMAHHREPVLETPPAVTGQAT